MEETHVRLLTVSHLSAILILGITAEVNIKLLTSSMTALFSSVLFCLGKPPVTGYM